LLNAVLITYNCGFTAPNETIEDQLVTNKSQRLKVTRNNQNDISKEKNK